MIDMLRNDRELLERSNKLLLYVTNLSISKKKIVLICNSIQYIVENRLDGYMILHYFNYLNHWYLIRLFDRFVYHQLKILFDLAIEHWLQAGEKLKVQEIFDIYVKLKYQFNPMINVD